MPKLKTKAAVSAIRDRFALDVCPCPSSYHTTYNAPSYAQSFANTLITMSLGMQFTYISHIAFADKSLTISNASVRTGMGQVFRTRYIFKVLYSVVSFIFVAVIHFLTVWADSEKCFGHKAMDKPTECEPSKIYRYYHITTVYASGRKNAVRSNISSIAYTSYSAAATSFKIRKAGDSSPIHMAPPKPIIQ